VLVRDDNLEFHERMVCGQVRDADHVVCTPTFEFFVEQLDVADEDIRFYDAAGNPPPGVYPADVCGFNITTGAQREVLVAEGIRIANRVRRSQGIGEVIVVPGGRQATGPTQEAAAGMNPAADILVPGAAGASAVGAYRRRPAPSTRLAAAPPAPDDDTVTDEEAEEAHRQRQAPSTRRAIRPRGSVGDQLAARGVDLILAVATGRPSLAADVVIVAGDGNGKGKRGRGRGGGRGGPADAPAGD
jgi:hypothetical protein